MMEDLTPGAKNNTGFTQEILEEIRGLPLTWAQLPPCPLWPDLN